MALDGDRLGTAIKTAVLALNPNQGSMSAGEKTQLENFCKAIALEIVNEFKNNADIQLLAGDIPVPSTGLVSAAPGAPVTGSAVTGPVTLTTKIK